jgi:hypothetical protein
VKPFRDALNLALRGRPLALRRVAERLLDAAESGDLASIRELADRLDGKTTQMIEPADAPINRLTDDQLYEIAASGLVRDAEPPRALPAPDAGPRERADRIALLTHWARNKSRDFT